jgi:hypothetical protein
VAACRDLLFVEDIVQRDVLLALLDLAEFVE